MEQGVDVVRGLRGARALRWAVVLTSRTAGRASVASGCTAERQAWLTLIATECLPGGMPGPDAPTFATTRAGPHATVGSLVGLLRQHYIDPEVAEEVSALLSSRLAEGAYHDLGLDVLALRSPRTCSAPTAISICGSCSIPSRSRTRRTRPARSRR